MAGANDPRKLEPILKTNYDEAKLDQEISMLSDLNKTKQDLVTAFHILDRLVSDKYQIFNARSNYFVDEKDWVKAQDEIASADVKSLDRSKIREIEYGVKRYDPVTYVEGGDHLVKVIDEDLNTALETISHLIAHLSAIDTFREEYITTKDGVDTEAPF